MPLPLTKPKIPEYPRPVSPICADEIPVCDDTIIYYDGNKGIEEDQEQIAAKRRRIESYAAAYRRGESLFIATAQLKGPFDKGWRNPWAQRRRTRTTTTAKRPTRSSNRTTTAVNETAPARKAALRNVGGPSSSCAPPRKSPSPSPQTDVDAVACVRPESSKGTPMALKPEPFSATKGFSHVSPSRTGKARSEQNIKPGMDHWLKRNDSYIQTDDAQLSFSSPLTKKSPHPHPRTKKWESSPIQAPPVLDPLVGIVVKSFRTVSAGPQDNGQHSKDLRSGAMSTKRPVTTRGRASFSGQAEAHQEVAIPAHTTVHVRPLLAEETHIQSGNVHAETSARLTTPNSPYDSRMANSASEHRPDSPGPALKNTSSRPEPTISDNHAQPDRLNITEAATDFTSLQGAEPKPSSVTNPLAASPEVRLYTNKTHSLPSAQVPARQTLPSGPSDLSSNGEMSELQTIQALPDTNEVKVAVGDAVRLDVMSEHDSVSPKAGEQLKMPKTDSTPGGTSAGTIIPLEALVTARKRATNEREDSHSPTKTLSCAATAARLTKTKRAKKTSFNTTSQRSPARTSTSQGSITSAMKIAKPATALYLNQNEVKLKGKCKLADSESESESLEDDNDDGTGNSKTPTPRGLETGPGRFSKDEGGRGRLARNSNSGPKSILRPSGPLSASSSLGARAQISSVKGKGAAIASSSSSSKHQDAQQPAKLRAMAVEAGSHSQVLSGSGDGGGSGFDLDAAIDDLGSFLGTWEAEKEAVQLGKVDRSQRSFIASETV